MRTALTSVVLLAVCILVCPQRSRAAALYSTSLEATLEFGGGAVEGGILQLVDPFGSVQTEDTPPPFPGFVNSFGSYDFVGRTIQITADSIGRAVFTNPAGPPVSAVGIGRTSASYGILNPSQFGFFLDLTLTGFFAYSGDVDLDIAELASTIFALSLFGDPLTGLTDEQLEVRLSTRSAGIGTNYSLVTSTTILGFRRTWSVLIPPFQVSSIGVFGQAGGQSISGFVDGGSFIVVDDPPGELPEVLPQPVPEPGAILLLSMGLLATAMLRRKSRT